MWRSVLISVTKHRHIAQSRGLFVAAKWQPAVRRTAVWPSHCYSTTRNPREESNDGSVDTTDVEAKKIVGQLRKPGFAQAFAETSRHLFKVAGKDEAKGFSDFSYEEACELVGVEYIPGNCNGLTEYVTENVDVPPDVLNLIASMYTCTTAIEGNVMDGNETRKSDFVYSLLVPILGNLFSKRFTLCNVQKGGHFVVAGEVILLVTLVKETSVADGLAQNMAELFAAAKLNSKIGIKIPIMGIVTTGDQWQLQQYDPNKTGNDAWSMRDMIALVNAWEGNSVEYWMKKYAEWVAPVAGMVHWALLTQERRYNESKSVTPSKQKRSARVSGGL